MMQIHTSPRYNNVIILNLDKKLNFSDLKLIALNKLLMQFMMEGNSLDAARHPLQIVQIKVDHPIYPNNMMRKEIS